ncbi:pyroglutamyl-peptidase 1 [Lasius niger]|uniref:Pyroglutamyl-peptidase 1 n=1 Tax=Lasius niger TaxID=67767 RepID=A0A0J7KZC1_LASNI|nr:pyroglutamyl-peptidase 1 [Lasius niger]
MLCNAIAAGLIVENNMNSEENDGNNQGKAEVKVDVGLKNDNQSMDQAAMMSKVQLENRAAVEELRLNNNSNDIKLVLPSVKTSVMFSNGTKSVQAPMSDCANSLEQNVSQDMSNVNISSMFTSTANIKPQTANTNAVNCQLKLKTVTNASALNLPKSQMHLNLSSTQVNTHLNHNLASTVLNSTATTSAMLHSSVSMLNAPLMPPNLSTSKPNDDIDMKNNVDYVSAIEKCPSKVSCSSDSSPEADCSWTSKSYGSKRVLNNIGGSIGSTSQGTCCFLRPNINGSREVAGPSGIQRASQREHVERMDSSSGNEGDMSDGEDYCIYTYKGNDDVIHLDQQEELHQGHAENHEAEEQNHSGRWDSAALYRNTGCPLRESYGYHNTSGDLISPGDNRDSDSELWVEPSSTSAPDNSTLNARRVNLSSTLYHRMMAKKLMLNKQAAFNQSGDSNLENELCNERLDGLPPVEKVMLWSEQEATMKQVTQIGTSACGATSAINALLALNVSFSLEVLVKGVNTRLRELGVSLPRYLVSRSVAGATHKDIARGISLSTNGAAVTKFFAFYPERKVSLSHWLHYWISRGAAPIATLNLQHCGEGCDIPDAWHHQMIFGVGQAGIYLTNPLECLPEQLVWHQLISPSILLIRKTDVLAHWNANTDLTSLATMDQKWRKLNVLGQVVNMVRESMSRRQQPNNTSTGMTHIRIPASYQAGITLVMCADSAAATELLHAEQLPLL